MILRTLVARFAGPLVLAMLCCTAAANASITVNKQFSPNVVNLGGSSTVTVTLQNSDTTAAAAITAFKDDIGTMAGGGVVDGGTPAATTCPGGTPTIAGNVVTMNNGSIPQAPSGTVPGSCTITFNVFGNKAGNSVNTINGADVTAAGLNPPGNVSQTLTVNSANVVVSAGAVQNVPFGSTATLTFQIVNPTATIPLTNAAFSLTNNSTQNYTVTGASTNCGATVGALPTNVASGAIAFTGATIPAGGSCTVTVQVTSSATITAATVNFTLPASPTAGSLVTDQNVTNSNAAATHANFEYGYPNIAKSFNPPAVRPGQTSTMKITIANTFTSQTLDNAQITDMLPANLTLDATAPVYTNCGVPAAVAGVGTGTAVFSGMTIPAAATCTITVVVDVPLGQPVATVTNSIPPTNFTSTEASQAGNTAQAQLIVTGSGGGYSMSKAASVGSVGPNTPFQYSVTFSSLATGAFTGGTFTDNLPAATEQMFAVNDTPAHAPTASAGCGAPTLTVTDGATSVSGSGLQIPSNGACTVTFWAQFTTPPPGVNLTDVNTVTTNHVSFLDAGNNPTAPVANASATVTLLPTLTVQNYLANGQTLKNQPLTMQTEIFDPTGTADSNFNLTIGLTAGNVMLSPTPNFTFGASCPAGLSAANVTIAANRESFVVNIPAINANCIISYDVIDEGGAVGSFQPQNPSYTSALSGGVSFAFAHVNTATFSTSNINISKAFAPNQIQAGGTAVASVTLSVAGIPTFTTTQANGVSFTDNLPATVNFAATPNPTFSAGCQVAGQPAPSAVIAGTAITFSNISLLTNGVTVVPCSVGFTVTSTTIGTPLNLIPAGAVTSTSGITNSQSVSASLTVASGIAVLKTFTAPSLQIGTTEYMRFLFTNSASTSVLSGGTMTDNMPAQLALASTTPGPLLPSDTVGLCPVTISGAVGGSNYQLTTISVPAVVGATPGQCVVYVPVSTSLTATPGGSATNTIATGQVSFNGGALQNQNPSSDTVSFTAPSDPTITKAFTTPPSSSNSIVAGGVALLTITINNTQAGAAALTGMALTDPLPANIVVAPTPNAATTCGAGTVTAVAGSASVSLANGALGTLAAPSASCTITVNVTSATGGIWTNSIGAGALTTTQGATNAAGAQAQLNVGGVSGVGITKAFAPTVIAPGATSVLTITLENTAATATPLTNIAVTDPLPANVTVAATPNVATTCPGGVATAAAGGSSVALTGASLAVNASCTITLNVTGTVAGTYVNTIPAGSITSTQGATNGAPAVADLTIGQPAVGVVKTSLPSGTTVSPGQTIAYTVVVTNGGTQAETNAHITDTLTNAVLVPGSVTVNGVAAPDAVVSAGQPFGTVAIGGSATIKYSAVVNAGAATGALVANTAVAGGDQPCANGTCSGSSPPNTVQPPVLAVSKLIDRKQDEAVVPGQTVTYGITVANSGSTPAINVTVTDVVPAGITVVPNSVTLNGVAYPGATLSGQTLTIPIAIIAAGASPVVSFQATVGANAGNAPNTATVMALGLARAAESNMAMARTVPATIVVTKAASATTVSTGDRVDYAIVVAPANGIAYGATTVVDTLPDYELYAPGTARVAGKAQEPLVAGHVLTWSLPSLTAPVTITYATAIGVGAPPNGTLTNTVNATAVAPGGGGAGHGSASASVLVVGTTLGSCYPITGRVYFDANGTGRFADPDVGLPNVHVFLDDGESVTTDPDGRYDFPCVHPGMHALRLDTTTLPDGVVPFDDRNIDSEKSTRRLVHHIYDTTIIEDINFALTGTAPALPARR